MANKLAQSTSPYLQQHAGNPVEWQEWGPEALAEARTAGKPILLSIGYSACHWCHVMAHESFEDAGIAALMNRLFVNIKVDREERPDLDQVYQQAHGLLTQKSGGWPLTMFLAPDGTPFFGGTYFPKSARYGLPGFGDLLQRVAAYYTDHQAEIGAQRQELVAALQANTVPAAPGVDTAGAGQIDAAFADMAARFDARHGGFGGAPKFPHPDMLDFCLQHFARTGDAAARHIACLTLERMCKGGIFDQLGGGFARYSTDATWTIPHFEKMLYDNGPLLRLLADASLVAENAPQRTLFAACAEATAEWVMREMQSPEGGYYASIDADSEGEEGRFYVWTEAEVRDLLPPDYWRVVELHYGLDQAPNFERHHWNLNVVQPLERVESRLGLSPGMAAIYLAGARQLLFDARERRIRPGRDDKILVSWNALMIEGMARAARVFGVPAWLGSARRALDFVREHMWNADTGRLYATHKDGRSHLNAYLDDYALLLRALLEMLQAEFHAGDLRFACALADTLLAQFEDTDNGGFYFTSHDHERLIQRPKPGADNAMPSGNGTAAWALQRLACITGEPRYDAAAQRALRSFQAAMSAFPGSHASLHAALAESLAPPSLLILTGPASASATWLQRLAGAYRPGLMVLAPGPAEGDLPDSLVRPATDEVNAWLCQGVVCLPAFADFSQLHAALKPPIVAHAE